MKITDGAKELIQKFLTENGAEGLRLSAVSGCCGPQYALSLNAPQDTDKVELINGIKVAIDKEITETDELTLDKEEHERGTGLVLLGVNACC
jgi:iron-sulfur cluster assembly protein